MNQMATRCHPIYCVVPPHVLASIAERGNPDQRRRAMQTLLPDQSFRSSRIALNESTRPFRKLQRRRRFARARQRWAAALEFEKQRSIYSADNTNKLPGHLVRSEGQSPSGDAAVDEAYDGLGATFDLYSEEYERNSIDDNGMPLKATVHYGQDYDNAYWSGSQMVFGDGDGELFNRFTISIDVTGHELTHGVTQHEAGLIYWAQAGALNESISDVFGSLVKQRVNKQKAEDADWLIGEGLLAPGVNGQALRSMKAPGTAYNDPVLGKDPQPAHMRDYVHTISDNGGVHINSGIPNHAFYLAATRIGGYAWEEAGLIWYETLRSPSLRRGAQFQAFAGLTVVTAQSLFGVGSEEDEAVSGAWGEVGILV
jgi:Zn-dependent metalloprotease